MRRTATLLAVVLMAASLSGCVFITRSNVSSSEEQANATTPGGSVSGDGRYIVFESFATNLVGGDTNGYSDVFVRDHQTGETERVSVSSTGAQANSASFVGSISDDGRYVSFRSFATNLVAGDTTSGFTDVFLHDRATGVTELVSISSTGAQANNTSSGAGFSDDIRYLTFTSSATNLVSGDTNSFPDVFVHDRTTGVTERVSVDSAGGEGNSSSGGGSISSDGRYVGFDSLASNLVAGDTNGGPTTGEDVFVHDRTTGVTERVSVDSTGAQAIGGHSFGGGMSSDGRYVSFGSFATNLVAGDTNRADDVFVHDRATGVTERVSISSTGAQAVGGSLPGGLSGDGRYVAFNSWADNLVPDDTNDGATDAFVRDRVTGITQRVSLGLLYQEANLGGSGSISEDGRYVALGSSSSNLVRNDTNSVNDVFLKFALAPRPLATTGSTSIPRGTTGQITITGSWLDPAFLQAWVGPAQGVTVDQIAVQNPNTTAVLTITVSADAQTGARDVFVFNPGNDWNPGAGGGDTCTGCLTVA